ncbi:hypothetical protein [Streptomyces triculaminicus]|uniref:hypothetical protein n=1 Tax=Streptomyces triculaminicus TaxID=2816232 RepID=UPI0037A4F671
MLNQRTTVSEPLASELTPALGTVAEFLSRFPGLPAPSLTVHTDSVLVQFAGHPSHVVFPSVARLARALGSDTHLKRMAGGGWHFQAHGRLRGLEVTVFAATSLVTDPVRTDEVEA